MVETKSLEATRKRWEDAIPRVGAAYKTGIDNSKPWQAPAMAAEELWAQKVQEAAAARRRAKKISEVSDETWKNAARDVGSARISAGMTAKKEKFASGITKVLDKLHSINLPARTADPAANVTNRVIPIAVGLAELKK